MVRYGKLAKSISGNQLELLFLNNKPGMLAFGAREANAMHVTLVIKIEFPLLEIALNQEQQ